jgi:hypothetical protein
MLNGALPRNCGLYAATVAALDPQRTWDELHALAASTHQPVLISYEKAPFSATRFCHRALSRPGREAGSVSSVRELSQ